MAIYKNIITYHQKNSLNKVFKKKKWGLTVSKRILPIRIIGSVWIVRFSSSHCVHDRVPDIADLIG